MRMQLIVTFATRGESRARRQNAGRELPKGLWVRISASGGDGLGQFVVRKMWIGFWESLVFSKPQKAVQIGA